MSFDEFRAGLAAAGVDENLIALARVDSTNLFARTLAYRLGPSCPPATVVAWCQQAGRGRLGRRWSSPAGKGVYASMVRNLAASRLPEVPLLTGVGLAVALSRTTGLDCRVKWPNDLLVGGAKLGGVLVETVVRPGMATATVVIGFGINVAHDRAQLPRPDTTSVALETGVVPFLPALTAASVAAVDGELRHAGSEGYAVSRFSQFMVHRIGERLTCRVAGETLVGELAGFDGDGLLRLLVGGRERRIAAAETVESAVGEREC